MNVEEVRKKLLLHTPKIMGSEQYTRYAVLLPLVKKEDGIHILFEERALTLKRQPGDICFPGGKVDVDDANEEYTAIRETIEELGLKREDIGRSLFIRLYCNSIRNDYLSICGIYSKYT